MSINSLSKQLTNIQNFNTLQIKTKSNKSNQINLFLKNDHPFIINQSQNFNYCGYLQRKQKQNLRNTSKSSQYNNNKYYNNSKCKFTPEKCKNISKELLKQYNIYLQQNENEQKNILKSYKKKHEEQQIANLMKHQKIYQCKNQNQTKQKLETIQIIKNNTKRNIKNSSVIKQQRKINNHKISLLISTQKKQSSYNTSPMIIIKQINVINHQQDYYHQQSQSINHKTSKKQEKVQRNSQSTNFNRKEKSNRISTAFTQSGSTLYCSVKRMNLLTQKGCNKYTMKKKENSVQII